MRCHSLSLTTENRSARLASRLVTEMGRLGEVSVDLSVDRGGLWITA